MTNGRMLVTLLLVGALYVVACADGKKGDPASKKTAATCDKAEEKGTVKKGAGTVVDGLDRTVDGAGEILKGIGRVVVGTGEIVVGIVVAPFEWIDKQVKKDKKGAQPAKEAKPAEKKK